MENKKVVFEIHVDHALDLITNSSSELFVLKGQTPDIVREMVREAYPDYINEYRDVRSTSELAVDEIDTYITYHYKTYAGWEGKNKLEVIPGFTFDEMYHIDPWWKKHDGREQYSLRPNFVEDHKERLKKAIDPNNEMYFLFSRDDNPNWDMQEKLMDIGDRYHLG